MKARCSRQAPCGRRPATGDRRRRTEKTIANDGSSHVSCFFSVDIQIMLLFAPIAMCAMLFVVAHRTALLPFFVHYAQYCIQFSIIQAFSFVCYIKIFFRTDMIIEKVFKKIFNPIVMSHYQIFLQKYVKHILSSKLMKSGQNIRMYKYFVVYRTRAIITHGLYTFYPLFEVHLCTVTFGLMYG